MGQRLAGTTYNTLALRTENQVCWLELRRPERLNAVGMEGVNELLRAAEEIAADDNTRMVAITGQGRAFSTGIDLKELAAGQIDQGYFDQWDRALRIFETMDKLVLCLVHGYAVGGGLQLALASDIRICTPSAQLGLPAIKEGLIPGLGTWRLARYVGMGRAKSLIIRGNLIDGTESERIGMVDHLVDEEHALEKFQEWVADYANSNSAGCRAAKALLLDCFDLGYDAFFKKYLELQSKAMQTADFAEAMTAYHENRTPNWE